MFRTLGRFDYKLVKTVSDACLLLEVYAHVLNYHTVLLMDAR